MRAYIAGPMSGIEAHNFPLFDRVAAWLRGRNVEVVSPAEIARELDGGKEPRLPYGEYMRADIEQLITCTCIFLLPGWRESRGASLEQRIAEAIGLPCFELHLQPGLNTDAEPAFYDTLLSTATKSTSCRPG